MNTPIISIIIPAYNVEKYLDKCLQSVCAQTMRDIEIILINDGSTDNTPAICDKWAAIDDRIRVVHQQNSGLAHLCNSAVTISRGEFIGFVDSDDWVEADMFEQLYQSIKKHDSDISICGINRISEDGILKSPQSNYNERTWSGKRALTLILMDHTIQNYRWNKLFKRELFNDISFPPNRVYEDLNTLYKLFEKARSVSHTGHKSYHYLQRMGSIMNTVNPKSELDAFKAFHERYLFILNYHAFSGEMKRLISVFPLKALLNIHYYVTKIVKSGYEEEKNYMLKIIQDNYLHNYNPKWHWLHNIILSLQKKPLKWFYR